MAHRIRKSCDYLMSHNIMILLFLTLIVLSFSSIGDTAVAGMIGLALCMAGCVQGAVTVDLWVLVPMLIYDLFSLASSWSAYGTITKGFAGTQIIFTVIYLAMAYLDQRAEVSEAALCRLDRLYGDTGNSSVCAAGTGRDSIQAGGDSGST